MPSTRRAGVPGFALIAVLSWLVLRPEAAGIISGSVFEDYNGNGLRDTAATIANASGIGSTPVAVDRGVAGVTVSAYDGQGTLRGTATTDAAGAYALSATGTGPYRVEFTNLPAGYHPSRVAAGATGNGSTVQFVPDGNSSDINLAILDSASYCQNNPSLVTSCFVYGDAVAGPFGANPSVVDFPYGAGSNSLVNNASYGLPNTHALMVPASQVGAVFGLAYHGATNTLYASAFMKKHSGFGPGGTGAIYAINPATGTSSVFADLNAIYGPGTAGVDPHDPLDYDVDNGNATWNAVGKVGFGGLEVAPDGSRLYVVNLADRQVYSIPTVGPINAGTIQRASIPLNAPGATGVNGADLRPFALQWFQGQLYLGIVNSAESAGGTVTDLWGYVYTVNPTTLAFSAAPVLQFPLFYPRGSLQTFSGDSAGEWLPWRPTLATNWTEPPVNPSVGTYPQPMLTGLSFDRDGNLVIGLRDRAGDQFGYFALDDPGNVAVRYEGVAGGDTLFAAVNTPGDVSSGWTLENDAQALTFGPTGGQGNGEGPGGGEYFFEEWGTPGNALHRELSGGTLLQLPGFPDVVTSAFDPGLDVRTGGFLWMRLAAGTRTKGYELYSTGFTAPPQPTFSKANGFGELVSICQAAPIEIGNRVWEDVDGDGVQDANEPGLDGITVQLLAPDGVTVLGTVVTANGGQYYFSSQSTPGLQPNTTGYRLRVAPQPGLGGRAATTPDNDSTPNGNSRDSDGVVSGPNVDILFNTGAPGSNDHTLDFGFLVPLSLGNLVWFDTNDNGQVDIGEQPVDGVDVVLFRDGGDGLFNAATDTLVGTQTTAGGGLYLFTGLAPGAYFVQVPAAEFGAGQPLSGYRTSSGQTSGDVNDADHGAPAPVTGQGIVSDLVTLTTGGEPTTDGDADDDTNLTIDFGFYRLALGNLVFVDANNSGTFDGGDTPRDGVTVELLDAAGTTVLASTVTAGGGLYAFSGLAPGDYRVRITPPAGYTSSTGGGSEPAVDPDGDVDGDDNGTVTGATITSAAITLTPGAEPVVTASTGDTANPTLDFGLIPVPGLSLGNLVWRDTNNDGAVSPGEPGIDGVTVRLYDASGTTLLGTQVTAGGGFYLFGGLTAGDYVVEVVTPASHVSSSGGGTEPAPDPDGDTDNDDNGTTSGAVVRSLPVTLTLGGEPTTDGDADANSNLTVDFGFVPQSVLSLGNLVWLDVNGNGLADIGEPGVAGVTMRLLAANGTTVLGTTTTNGAGLYLFSGLAAGTYFVEVDRTSGALTGYLSSGDVATSATPDNDVDDDDNGVAVTSTAVRSAAVTLSLLGEPVTDGDADANSNLTVDFGFVRAVSVGNLVWADLNNNAVVDSGEPGIGGVAVRLIAADGVTVVATTSTDATGHYLFGGLPPGTYYVEVVPPAGATSSTDIGSSATPNNDVDNDDNGVTVTPGAVRSGPITLGIGTEPVTDGDANPDSNLTVDFGFVPAPGGGLLTDLCLQQSVPPTVTAGGQMTVVYTAENRGPGVATEVIIDGMLPPGVSVVSTAPSAGGTCSVMADMLICRWAGTTAVGPGAARQVAVVFQAGASVAPGTAIPLWFMTSSSNTDPYPACNMVDSYVFVAGGPVPPVDLVITATAGAPAAAAVAAPSGQPVPARFTVTNTGATTAQGQYAILLDEAGLLEVTAATWSPQGWAGATNATSGTWDTGPIAPGGTAVLDLLVVPRTGTASKIQAVRIAGTPADPNAANDQAEFVIDAVGPGGGRTVAAGNLDGAASDEIVTGAGAGETPQVRVFSAAGLPLASFYAFDRGFRGGVRVAACDVNGDGTDELVAAQGQGGGRVRVLSWTGGVVNELVAFDAFEPGFAGGVNVACGDLDLDGRAEVVVGPDGGRAPDVKVFGVGVLSAVVTAQFQAFEPAFSGGVRVAAARFGGSGLVGPFNVLVAAGPGRAQEVRAFQVSGLAASVVAAAGLGTSTAGVRVAFDDLDGDASPDLLIAPDGGAPLLVQALSLTTGATLLAAPPGAGGFQSVHVAVGRFGGGPELVVGQGPGGAPVVATVVVAGGVAPRLVFQALETP